MAGLFDTYKSPEEVQRGITQEGIKQDRAAPTGWGAINAAAAGGGRMLAQGLGGQDPRVAKAQSMQNIMEQMATSGLKPNTYEFNIKASQLLREAGHAKEAFGAAQQAEELRVEQVDKAYEREGEEQKRTERDLDIAKKEAELTPEKKRFKAMFNGKPVIGFSDDQGNVYARIGGKLLRNPPGLIEVVTGTTEHDPGAITKKTSGTIEKKIMSSADLYSGLEKIGESYFEQSLTWGGKAEALYLKSKEKLGFDLTPEQAEVVNLDTDMRQETFDVLNTYIHDLSGAAVSVQEAQRLSKSMPTMDDSPTEFKRKVLNVKRKARALIDRYQYWKEKGLVREGMTDKDMEKLERTSAPPRAYSVIKAARAAIASGQDKTAIIKEITKGFKEDGWDLNLIQELKGL